MANGEKIWKTHPMTTLDGWQPGGAQFEREEFTVHHQILEATLSLYGLNPTAQHGDRKTYYFASDNAKAWAQVAVALYGVLDKRLFTPYFEGNQLKSMPRATMDADSIAVVADYLDTFSVLLDLPPIKAILTDKTFTALLQPAGTSAPAAPATHEQQPTRTTSEGTIVLFLHSSIP